VTSRAATVKLARRCSPFSFSRPFSRRRKSYFNEMSTARRLFSRRISRAPPAEIPPPSLPPGPSQRESGEEGLLNPDRLIARWLTIQPRASKPRDLIGLVDLSACPPTFKDRMSGSSHLSLLFLSFSHESSLFSFIAVSRPLSVHLPFYDQDETT